eukprot:SAG25_NODE_1_length_41698_cov_149.842015_39_plen_96_part_00
MVRSAPHPRLVGLVGVSLSLTLAPNVCAGRTLIRSCWEGSYQVAQATIDGAQVGPHAKEAQRVFGGLPVRCPLRPSWRPFLLMFTYVMSLLIKKY